MKPASEKAIKLASNENPLGPSPMAKAALLSVLDNLHRYPDGSGYYLKHALAERLSVSSDQVVLGNGSNEIIELSVRTFLKTGGQVVTSEPTFLVYSKVIQGAGGTLTAVPLKGYRHNLSGLIKAIGPETNLLFLDNPNNPTGTLVPKLDLDNFIRDLPRHCVLVLDEAYRDFVRQGDLLEPGEYLDEERPIIFLRTFSKAYGIAGLRIGYGLAHRELVGYLDRVRQPFNVNTLAQVGAMAALKDDGYYRDTLELVWSGLDWLTAELKAMGLQPFPTQTNFMMIELDRPATEVCRLLQKEGVIARSLASYGLERVMRINAGRPEENTRFIASLKRVLDNPVQGN